ncbi:hypothetical protein FN846DRAFT_928574 [Sphaerosporella brunnea]|uniref:F-box domain-containing protein n=1 Tax=Sphaerosporella brunnea TaxID=1250544 RepID=A0A5J5F9V7_9PEZI|nr:hypothetical protein FN846DRAFT_928574 [Sphaerosporella brunnea]
MHFSIGPWSRVLQRLDAIPTEIVMASVPRSRKRALQSTPEGTQPPSDASEFSPPTKRMRFTKRSAKTTAAASVRLHQMTHPKPSTTTDPFEFLPTHIVADVLRYISPLEVIRNQRVSKAWRVVLASEYIYTLALRWHFPFSSEAENVWKLHHGGERYPAAAVDGYRAATARYSRIPKDVKTWRTTPASREADMIWTLGEGRLVFCDTLDEDKRRIGVQGMEEGSGTTKWIDLGNVSVMDLTVGGGLLRVYYRRNGGGSSGRSGAERPGSWMRLYDFSDLSLKWKTQVEDGAVMVQNMTEAYASYLSVNEAYNLHLLSSSTGEQIKLPSSIHAPSVSTPPLSSFLTPNNSFLVLHTDDSQLRIFSTETGDLATSIPVRAANHDSIRYHFCEATETLAVTDGIDSTAWMISFRDNKVNLRETLNHTASTVPLRLNTATPKAVLSPEGHNFAVYIEGEKAMMDIALPSSEGVATSKRAVELLESPRGKLEEGSVTTSLSVREFRCEERWVVVRFLDGDGTLWVAVDFAADLGLEKMDVSSDEMA